MKSAAAYYKNLLVFREELKDDNQIDLEKFDVFKYKMVSGFDILNQIEKKLTLKELRERQKNFRDETNIFFKQSYFMNRARTWPYGYPGDHEMLEKIYQAMAVSKQGIGLYLDNYFLNCTLAKGVRERKTKLSALLIREIENREANSKIMNIGCGSSREIFDIGAQLNQYAPKMTFLDFDEKATQYSKNLLFNAEIDISNFVFKKFNALKLANIDYTKKTFESQDIIYSAGLFDYLTTKVLTKIIGSLYELLNYDGLIIAPFKDAQNYKTFDYHWLSDWSYFHQRNIEDVRHILEMALPPKTKIRIESSPSPAINFFIIEKK